MSPQKRKKTVENYGKFQFQKQLSNYLFFVDTCLILNTKTVKYFPYFVAFPGISRLHFGNDWWNKARATLYINHFQKTEIYQLNFILSVDFNKIWSLKKMSNGFLDKFRQTFRIFSSWCVQFSFGFLTNIQTKKTGFRPNPNQGQVAHPRSSVQAAKAPSVLHKVRRSVSLLCGAKFAGVVESLSHEGRSMWRTGTLQGKNSHITTLPKGKSSSNIPLGGDMLVPRKVCLPTNLP